MGFCEQSVYAIKALVWKNAHVKKQLGDESNLSIKVFGWTICADSPVDGGIAQA